MTYIIVIPPKYVEKLTEFREYFEQSMRSQILEAIESYIRDIETELMQKMI